MKGTVTLSSIGCLVLLAGIPACSKSREKKDVAPVAQDTMLLHDLAEANRNTAAAEATDTTEAVLLSRSGTPGGAGPGALTSGATTTPSDTRRTTASRDSLPARRITAPTRSADATGPTNVNTRMESPDSQRSPSRSGDVCDSPAMSDQRACLSRSIAANDVDLNRTYRDLIAQARLSGGPDLEERFRQSQRDWVDRRDTECRAQTSVQDGKLWARAMSRCLADYSNRRTSELQSSLNQLRGQ